MLDELLSTIPSSERTSKVLNSIHTMIERFKQLRMRFSEISSGGEIIKPKKKGYDYKPLIERLKNFNQNLYWILPIVKNKRKLYDVNDEDLDDDIINLTLSGSQDFINQIFEQYKNNEISDGQNKYNYLLKTINTCLTPFSPPEDMTDVVSEQHVNRNVDVIVNNLEDFYSSVVENDRVNKTRFVIDKYNIGLDQLHKDEHNKKKPPFLIPLTNPDRAAFTGILTLKKPALLYSHINLPNTSILMKAHLGLISFNYWSLLKKDANIFQKDINLDEDGGVEEIFLDEIKAYMFKENEKFQDRTEDSLERFLNRIIPNTRKLFEMIKKHIKNNTSYLKILEYLEPFFIYPDDISFKQYEDILIFMREKNQELRRKLVANDIILNTFIAKKYPSEGTVINNLKELQKKDNIQNDIFSMYHMTPTMGTAEAVKRIFNIDNSRLFTSGISLQDIDLFQPIEVDKIIRQALDERNPEISAKETPVHAKKCNNILAKHYIDINDLREEDNVDPIYFDKKYDNTPYGIGESWLENNKGNPDVIKWEKDKQNINLSRNVITQLAQFLHTNNGIMLDNAMHDATAMIDGKRQIQLGDYAYILDDEHKYTYFKRNNQNKWERDKELSGQNISADMFCNFKKGCIKIDKRCSSMEKNRLDIQKNLYMEILDQFEEKFHQSIDKLRKNIQKDYEYNLSNIKRIRSIIMMKKNKYDALRIKIGQSLDIKDIIESPNAELRDRILSQTDFVKKQSNLLYFISLYCRSYNPIDPNENEFWFYCIHTKIPLLPTFYKELADAYSEGIYGDALNRIIAKRGEMSDDGDKVVDKYSGHVIRRIDYDESEGYDDSGFKMISKAVLEADIEKIMSELDYKIPDNIQSKSSKLILNIVKTMDKNLGISIDSQLEFIISNVNNILELVLPSKELYNKKMARIPKKKRKKLGTYDNIYNESIILITLCVYLISLQTMIPNIRTQKTFPGCVRSFKGFPLDGDGDTSALQYIACAALKLRSKTSPWDRLPRVKKGTEIQVLQKFSSKLKLLLEKNILENPNIKLKIQEKIQYLATAGDGDKIEISEEFDIQTWATFLPPLKPIIVLGLHNISPSFKRDLDSLFRKGNSQQFVQLSILRSKIFYFSLHIQELIQRVINKKKLLMFNAESAPFVENSCCNDGSKHTLQYFINVEPNILKYNKIVFDLEDILNYSHHLTKPLYLFDPRDTKLKFQVVSEQFSEKTIYKAFIKFCAFNTGHTLNSDFLRICVGNTSGFTNTDDIDDKIAIMKREGKVYSRDSFYQLLNLINLSNIVLFDFNPVILSARLQIEHLINDEVLKRKVSEDSLEKILNLLKEIWNRYESTTDAGDEAIQDAYEFLNTEINNLMDTKILPFIYNYGNGKKHREFIRDIEKLKMRGDNIYLSREDETAFAEMEFLKQAIYNILKIFPSVIKNSVDYNNIKIPEHWKVSDTHVKDLKHIISQEFQPIMHFYGNEQLNEFLGYILDAGDNVLKIMNTTPFYANIRKEPGAPRTPSLFNGKLLEKFMKFYFLYALNIYLEILEEKIGIIESKNESKKIGTQLGNLGKESLIQGKQDNLRKQIAQLLVAYLDIIMNNKNIINFSDKELKDNILKFKEKEKARITKKLGDLTIEELQVEDIMKNHKLGKWGLGLTKALYEYDQDQYEKERKEIESDALNELKLGANGWCYITDERYLLIRYGSRSKR